MYEGSYVLVRVNENADTRRVFVAPPGSACSYTTDVLRARKFKSREHAKSEACGNEYPVAISDLL